MFLQAGYGHGHVVRQGSLLGARELPQAEQAAHAITGLLKLPFEPSMLWTADSIGRRGAHRAPVENVEEQCSRKANKRQILFSPIVRSPAGLAFRVSTHRSKGFFYGQTAAFPISRCLRARRCLQSRGQWARRNRCRWESPSRWSWRLFSTWWRSRASSQILPVVRELPPDWLPATTKPPAGNG
jgi:hypothetical protein